MIINSQLKSISNITKSLTLHLTKSYIKQSDIDQYSKKYHYVDFITKSLLIFHFYIGGQALKAFRSDVSFVTESTKKRSQQPLNYQQTVKLMQISSDLKKMFLFIILQCTPYIGSPIYYQLMEKLPESVPHWFMIDTYHERHQDLKIQNQTKALKYFQKIGLKSQQINLKQISLSDLRKMSLLLFGVYRDGTVVSRRLFNKKIPYFISQNYSKRLIMKDMIKRFQNDLLLLKYIHKMTQLEDIIRWKYNKMMKSGFGQGQNPLYEKTLERILANEGKEGLAFLQVAKQDLEPFHRPNKSKTKSQGRKKDSNVKK